jgi:hypothetical protein
MTTSSTTFRAAYWIAADGQSSILLTDDGIANESDDVLAANAAKEMEYTGLVREDGDRIVIGDWNE